MRRASPKYLRALFLSTAFLSLAALGCPKQEDFPTSLDLVVPPKPTNFVITNPQGNDYDFAWQVSDPSIVDRYRVYLLGSGFTPDEVIFETTASTYLATFPYPVTDLQFAVSAISTQGVEGQRTVQVAP